MTETLTTPSIPQVVEPQLPSQRIVGYGFGDAGCNIAFQMSGLFRLVFWTDVVSLQPAHSAAIFGFIKIWDAFADLFAGRVVDRTMTRWGKFRPFLLWYSVPLLLSNLLCFWMPFTSYGWKLVWATGTYALMGLLYSLVNIPFGSLAGAMSQNAVDRSRMASARMVGSGATILLLSLFLAPRLKKADDLASTFLVTALVFVLVGAVFFFTTFATSKEVVFREVERVSLKETFATMRRNGPLLRLCLSSVLYLTGQSVVSAMGIYVATYVLGQYSTGGWVARATILLTTGAVLYVGPFGPVVTRRLGKKLGFMASCLLATACGVLFALSNTAWHSLASSLGGLLMVGVGMGLLNTMTWALEADTVEYGEYRTGIRTEGATYAAFSFTRKVGQAIGQSVGSLVLGWAGYRAVAQTQDAAVSGNIALWVGLLPGAIFLLACLVMAGYPLTETKFKKIMKSIEANRRLRHEELTTGAVPVQAPTLAERPGPSAAESHPATRGQAAVPGPADRAQVRILDGERPAPDHGKPGQPRDSDDAAH